MRSAWLFAPAQAERKAHGALASDADVVVLDLEDAVPEAEKPAARGALAALGGMPRRGALMVRVNAAGTPHCLRDIEAAVAAGVDGIMLPKAQTAEELGSVCWALSQFETALDRAVRIELVPLIETARGVSDLGQVRLGSRVRQAAFGSVDYALDLGLSGKAGDEAVTYAQFAMVLGSRRAGLLPPIDGVTLGARDAVATSRDAARARELGFGGKLAIHPAQILPIQQSFWPTQEEVTWAQEVIEASEATPGQGSGVFLVRDKLVDRPVLLQARRVLERVGALPWCHGRRAAPAGRHAGLGPR